MSEPISVLFISSAVKGHRCIEAFKSLGCRVYLLTEERWRHEDWANQHLDGAHYMHSLVNRQHVINTVAWMMRGQKFDLIIPLDEYEIETAATLREYFQIPGIGVSDAHVFNDKLAMRMRAQAAQLAVPEFTSVFNYDALRGFMARVPGPWLLKPRNEAGSMGIRRCENDEQVWRALDQIGDQQSNYLLEKFVPSDVFHVDSIVSKSEIVFSRVSAYGRPPLAVSHGGGVFTSRILSPHSPEAHALTTLNAQAIQALGLKHGAAHIEFLRTVSDKRWLFLEAANRVGGANLSDMLEHGSGVNPWVEWARLEVAAFRGEAYQPPVTRDDCAGILVCLAKVEWPDLSGYNAPEVAWRMHKAHHAGIIVTSPSQERIEALLAEYTDRFAADFLARAQPIDTGRMV